MLVVRQIVVRLVGVALVIALVIAFAGCGSAPANQLPLASDSQLLSALSAPPPPQQPSDLIWGRVPYCNCFADSATANVAGALKEANLTVSLQELSPRDGWLYFAVTFDPAAATQDQVEAAMVAGGAEVLDGPP